MTGDRQRRGRSANFSGAAAEESVARFYHAKGAEILARNWRCREGEIDLIALLDGILVFIEVKQRRNTRSQEVVTEGQWRRLEQAANRYMMEEAVQTGRTRGMRFDLVVIGAQGLPEIYENARSFDDF